MTDAGQDLLPEVGAVIEAEDVEWGAIAEILGMDFEEALGEDAADLLTEETKPLVVIGGDVFLEGDATSSSLALGKEGYDPDAKRGDHTVLVLGDVHVTGALHVEQDAQLLVRGAVRARTLHGASANLIVKEPIHVAELACFEQSEEGGIVACEAVHAPLTVRLDSAIDTDFETVGEVASDVIDEDAAALRAAASTLTGEAPAKYSLALYRQISDLIAAGRAAEFVLAYRAARSA